MHRPDLRGFTLIELILVMALLAIVLAVATPALARFFRGRTLDSEAHRFLALTRYGQSRAVSEGVPMVLWLDADQGRFGLEAEPTYLATDRLALEFEVNEDVAFEVEVPATRTTASFRDLTAQVAGQLPAIRFTPDGFLGEHSPEWIVFYEDREGDDGTLWIGQSRNRLHYEIQTSVGRTVRR